MTHQILGLDHVQLAMPVGAEAEAIAFFSGVLGLRQRRKPDALAGRGGCWFQAGAVQLHVGADPDFRPAKKAHPALMVDGLDALVEALISGGHPVREGATIAGVTQLFTDDPFGNRIELVAAG
mgnify:CR=1 FL=1